MRRARRSRPLPVCLLSPHPLVLGQFQKLLARPGLRLQTRVVEPSLAPRFESLRLPRASVYVVDAQTRLAAERLLVAILDRTPAARPLLVAEKFSEANAFPLLRLGAKGLVRYGDAAQQLGRAVESVAGGGFWVPRGLLARFVDSMLKGLRGRRWAVTAADLSPREQQVLDAVLNNLANKEIAARLNISERTAKFHVSNLLTKFGVQRRHDLILHCLQGQPTVR